MEGANGSKAFAHQLVSQYALGMDAARFSVVSFAAIATTRVPWSINATEINAGIGQMSADGKTSISDGFEAVRQLFFDDGRVGATKIVLLLSDGVQSDQFSAPGKTPLETVVDAATLVKESGVTVFAWGIGKKVALTTLEMIATDPSKAILVQSISELNSYLGQLQAAICTESPPPPASPSPPSLPPSPKRALVGISDCTPGSVWGYGPRFRDYVIVGAHADWLEDYTPFRRR
eukprot:scaffold19819_cov57-Phaeocystis_antarctica.AAC.1